MTMLSPAMPIPQIKPKKGLFVRAIKPKPPETVPVILIRPLEDGGSIRERLEASQISSKRCIWYYEGKPEYILFLKPSGQDAQLCEPQYSPVHQLEKAAITPHTLYDANNPNALHACWRAIPTGLQKIAIGVLALLTIGLFVLAFAWLKGGK